jgi:hypothetical protein
MAMDAGSEFYETCDDIKSMIKLGRTNEEIVAELGFPSDVVAEIASYRIHLAD